MESEIESQGIYSDFSPSSAVNDAQSGLEDLGNFQSFPGSLTVQFRQGGVYWRYSSLCLIMSDIEEISPVAI